MVIGMKRNVKKRKLDFKDRMIKRQSEEIESLKNKIEELNLKNEDEQELISSVEKFRGDMDDILKSISERRDKYDELISELLEMRKVMNAEVFKGRWKIIRWLLK